MAVCTGGLTALRRLSRDELVVMLILLLQVSRQMRIKLMAASLTVEVKDCRDISRMHTLDIEAA